jgi:cytoskeletal protein CcmA (bactofilin family)
MGKKTQNRLFKTPKPQEMETNTMEEINASSPGTFIADDVEIVGSIKSGKDVRLDGKLSGDLTCGGKATIGQTATIKGNISADSVTVHGQINGNITVKDRIELKATAHLNGDIRAKRLTVEDGVTFVGKSEVNPTSAPASRTAQEAKPAEAEEGDDDTDDNRKAGLFNRR